MTAVVLQCCCRAAAELLQAAVITQTFGKSSASNIFMLRDVEQNFHVISHNIFCSTPKYQRWGLSQISFKHVLPILNPEKPLQSMRCGDYLRSLHKDSFKVYRTADGGRGWLAGGCIKASRYRGQAQAGIVRNQRPVSGCSVAGGGGGGDR